MTRDDHADLPSEEERSRQRPRRVGLGSRRQILWTLVALVVAVPIVILPYIDLVAGGLVPIAQALLPAGALALLVLAVVPLLARAWVAASVLAVAAVLAVVPVLTPLPAAIPCETSTPLTVLSFNAKFAGADPQQLAELVRSSGAGAVILVETDEALLDAVLAGQGLASELPYRTGEVSPYAVNGSVILSAYPLRDESEIPGSVFDQVSAVATLPDGSDVRLAAVHPPPPIGQPDRWYDGVAAIGVWIRGTDDQRLIVAGDFNASFSHPVFRDLTSGLRTAAEAAGAVPWPTWPQEKPVPAFTAIDHVLGRGAVPTGWDSVYIEGSDHRAVIANWMLCEQSDRS
ncbi:endonuclease/exonuclease/phosphatase family protein [Microbacterium schleiferi]|uniref:Endonuclease/exonuclease/phosphatase family protein n=1 Tax=Microbacterium schleiferi TaxID=69362 RepID=A0A7S8RHY8_9MICO|nr:endonuclease/exonuclease/phosphatase family protein [Microbacterium schleiferi]QPE04836.1 endonuclease/exonuclease/phosphatase family protein [Microbacterium schleiferi]